MEKKYISENRYKKSTVKRHRSIKATSHNSNKKVKHSGIKKSINKSSNSKQRNNISARKQSKMKRRNIFTCIILIILIAVIARVILKEDGEPFIPIFFGEEENEQVISIGIITTDDLLNINTNNTVLKELEHYSNNMLLKINEDYSLEYDVIESIDKITNREYILNIKKSKEYNAYYIKQVLDNYRYDVTSIYYDNLKEVENISVLSDRELNIIVKEANPYFVYNLDIPVIKTNKKQYIKSDNSTSSYLVYERTKYASKEAPLKIIVKSYKDMYAGVEAYKNEEINALITNQKNVQNILGKYEYNVKKYRNGETIFLFLNKNSEVLSHSEIRKVVAYSIDRTNIVNNIMQSAADIIDLPYIYDIVKYKYDIYAAENLLLSNGYKKVNKIYVKDGNQLSLKLIVNKADDEKVSIANVIKNNLNSIGIKVTVEKLSVADIEKRIEKGNYDLILTSVNLNNKPDISFLMEHMYNTEQVTQALNKVNDEEVGNLHVQIKNILNLMSNDIACIGILAKTNYVIYAKDIIRINDISYLNILNNLIIH